MTIPKIPGAEAFLLATFAVAFVAAAFDWRTKRIPNVLTIGGILLAFPLHAWLSPSVTGYQSAALGCLACAVPPAVGWRLGWVAGGDVKLLAAMGALGGISFGLEAVFFALFCASGFIFLRLCWNGVLLRTAANGMAVAATRTFYASKPSRVVRAVPEFSSELRFGPFALAGATMSLFLHGAFL
jgi:prepilin peptidase CpaA